MTDQTNKNAIFSGGQGGAQVVPDRDLEVTREDYVRSELGFEVPTSLCPLPTQGKIYPEGHPLRNAKAVEIRTMTTREVAILTNPASYRRGTIITELIQSCLVDRRINANDIIAGDAFALLYAIRSLGIDQIYSPEITCPNCESKQKEHIDLNEIEIKGFGNEPVVEGKNLFEFILPNSGKKVHYKLLTLKEQQDIILNAEQRRKKNLQPDTIADTLRKTIVSVEGNTSPGYISSFVNNMIAKDSFALSKHQKETEPGVETEFYFVCGSCDHTEELVIPMTSEFFRLES